jgi:hypothetical protein
MSNAGSRVASERATPVRVCLPVLFHLSFLNIERAIVRARNVDSYDDKRTEQSCWMSSARMRFYELIRILA